MRYSRRHFVSLRTLGLAFAVALSPAFMQGAMDCSGDTTLAELELRAFEGDSCMPAENMVAFDPQVKVYQVEVPDLVTQAMLIAEPTDPTAGVAVQCYVEGVMVAQHVSDPEQRWTVVDLPEGDSTIHVYVKPAGGAVSWYAIDVHRF